MSSSKLSGDFLVSEKLYFRRKGFFNELILYIAINLASQISLKFAHCSLVMFGLLDVRAFVSHAGCAQLLISAGEPSSRFFKPRLTKTELKS